LALILLSYSRKSANSIRSARVVTESAKYCIWEFSFQAVQIVWKRCTSTLPKHWHGYCQLIGSERSLCLNMMRRYLAYEDQSCFWNPSFCCCFTLHGLYRLCTV
jgi:hypothetical protein